MNCSVGFKGAVLSIHGHLKKWIAASGLQEIIKECWRLLETITIPPKLEILDRSLKVPVYFQKSTCV